MKPGMKMLMLTGRESGMDSKYRDRRGREHYETGRYAPKNGYDGMENNYPITDNYDMENRYNGVKSGYDDMESRRRYRRDSRGRFRSEMGGEELEDNWREGSRETESNYPNRPFPVYREDANMRYRGDRMNQIGFVARGNEIQTNYRMNAGYNSGNEMEHRSGYKMGGSAASAMTMPITREIAEEWTENMKNEDGTKGPHWKMEQVKQLMAQKGIQYNPWEFFAILNALYSDYCAVLKKHGMNNIDVYVDLASAWLNDSDAMPEKAARYYEYIVKK